MKKVIRLTESDLTRIVKRVINEQNNDPKNIENSGNEDWKSKLVSYEEKMDNFLRQLKDSGTEIDKLRFLKQVQKETDQMYWDVYDNSDSEPEGFAELQLGLIKRFRKKLNESDLDRIVKRIIRESIDYDETTEEFYKIKDILVDLAEKGEFILHINDNRNPNETYGYNKSSSNIKKDVFVRINQPTIMVIVPRSDDKYFGSNFTDLLTRQFEYEFPTMNFSGDYGYSIEVRPKKFMEQGFYDKQKI